MKSGRSPGKVYQDAGPSLNFDGEALGRLATNKMKMPHDAEVFLQQMETRARQMVVDILAPTISKMSKLSNIVEDVRLESADTTATVRKMIKELDMVTERSKLISQFKDRLEEYKESNHALESRVEDALNDTASRIKMVESFTETQKANYTRLSRTVDRCVADIDTLDGRLNKFLITLEVSLQKESQERDAMGSDIQVQIKEMTQIHEHAMAEIWGDENISVENQGLSLWRLNKQVDSFHHGLDTAQDRLEQLIRLDDDMKRHARDQKELHEQQEAAVKTIHAIKEKAEQTLRECKQDTARVANMTAACTANLMKEIRDKFGSDLEGVLVELREVRGNSDSATSHVAKMNEEFQTLSRRMDSQVYEVRNDLEALEGRRRRDKQANEEVHHSLRGVITGTSDSTEATHKGLDHLSQVVSMALQSERMSVALELQDFVDRKGTPYVGVKDIAPRRGTRNDLFTRKQGINPDHLSVLAYDPSPISFQGQPMERTKLLSLREQLLHVAQQVLQQGPLGMRLPRAQGQGRQEGARDPMNPRAPPAPPIVPEVTGASPDIPHGMVPSESGSRSASRSSAGRRPSRPGSHRQPSARGSTPDAVAGDLAFIDAPLHAAMMQADFKDAEAVDVMEVAGGAGLPPLRSSSRMAGGDGSKLSTPGPMTAR